MAYALASLGSSIGIMTMPPLTQALLDAYGWRGAFLILGAINMNCMVAGAIYKSDVLPAACTGRRTSIQNDLCAETEPLVNEPASDRSQDIRVSQRPEQAQSEVCRLQRGCDAVRKGAAVISIFCPSYIWQRPPGTR